MSGAVVERSYPEARRKGRDAILSWIDAAREWGRQSRCRAAGHPPPTPRSEQGPSLATRGQGGAGTPVKYPLMRACRRKPVTRRAHPGETTRGCRAQSPSPRLWIVPSQGGCYTAGYRAAPSASADTRARLFVPGRVVRPARYLARVPVLAVGALARRPTPAPGQSPHRTREAVPPAWSTPAYRTVPSAAIRRAAPAASPTAA